MQDSDGDWNYIYGIEFALPISKVARYLRRGFCRVIGLLRVFAVLMGGYVNLLKYRCLCYGWLILEAF